MADSAAFELACDVLERDTSLDRLEARGTVRLALKEAGLEPRSVTPEQMAVVAEKMLAGELASRGVAEGERVCAALASQLGQLGPSEAANSPDAVFSRLGR